MTAPAHQSSLASKRVEQSRSNLRLAMLEDKKPIDKTPSAGSETVSSWDQGLQLLRSNPSTYLLAQTAQKIWAKNQWRILACNIAETADIMLTPFARRSPVKLVAGAFAVGALVLWARPWRLISKRALIKSVFMR